MNRLKVFFVSLLLALGGILSALVLGKRLKETKAQAASLRSTLEEAGKRAGRLNGALAEGTKVEGKANEERKDLAGTPDADLVHRANKLF